MRSLIKQQQTIKVIQKQIISPEIRLWWRFLFHSGFGCTNQIRCRQNKLPRKKTFSLVSTFCFSGDYMANTKRPKAAFVPKTIGLSARSEIIIRPPKSVWVWNASIGKTLYWK